MPSRRRSPRGQAKGARHDRRDDAGPARAAPVPRRDAARLAGADVTPGQAVGPARGRAALPRGAPGPPLLAHHLGPDRAGHAPARPRGRGGRDARAGHRGRLVLAVPAVLVALRRRGGGGDPGHRVRRRWRAAAVRTRSGARLRPEPAVHGGAAGPVAGHQGPPARPLRTAPGAAGMNLPMTPLPYRVVSRRMELADTVTLELRPEGAAIDRYVPGQFTMVYAFGVGEVPISISGEWD